MPFRKSKPKYIVRSKESPVIEQKKKEQSIEDKFFWSKIIAAIIMPIFGNFAFHLIGWFYFLWMCITLFGVPFIISFGIFRIPYIKGKWDWKMILKTGFGTYFAMFMLISIIFYTIIVMNDPLLGYANIFAHPT